MPAPAKTKKTTPNSEYQQAEQFINKSIAEMGTDSHIEYGNTMERNDHPPLWKRWLHRILKLH